MLDNRGASLGQADHSAASQIALRMLGRSADPIDISARIAAAQRFREQVVTDSTAYRLVHAEADFLPALIVDRYDDCFTVQALDQAMDRSTPEIVAALDAQFSPRAIVARNDRGGASLKAIAASKPPSSPGEIRTAAVAPNERPHRMQADLLHGQKTGIFLDQRENYRAAAHYARGGKALDCFTSTGGFALHLAAVCESRRSAG